MAGKQPAQQIQLTRRHVIIDEPQRVYDALRTAELQGRLVDHKVEARYVSGRIKVIAHIVDQPGPQPRRRRRFRTRVVVTVLAVACALLALAGWLLYLLVQALIAALIAALPFLLGFLAVLVVWWLLGQTGACPGLHCPGCRHH